MYAKNPAPPAAHEQPWQKINFNKINVVQILQLLAQPIDATHDRSAIRGLVGYAGSVLQQLSVVELSANTSPGAQHSRTMGAAPVAHESETACRSASG